MVVRTQIVLYFRLPDDQNVNSGLPGFPIVCSNRLYTTLTVSLAVFCQDQCMRRQDRDILDLSGETSLLPLGRSRSMKKWFIILVLITGISAGNGLARGRAKTNFSGTWVLDMQKTQDVPSRLQSYKMNVTETDRQIIVKSKVEGELRSPRVPDGGEGGGYPGGEEGGGGRYPGGGQRGGGYPGGGYPGGGIPGIGFPRGGRFPIGRRGGYPGSTGGRGEQMRKSMAFAMVTPIAIYNLDGSSSTTQVEKPIPGSETLKAAWKKRGKQLDLSRVESLRGGERSIKVHEQWRLSKDGRTLEVQRSVNTPRGSTKVKMIFSKEESAIHSAN